MATCKDCIHYDVCCHWSTTDLEKDEAYKYCYGNFKSTADVREVKHGEWVRTGRCGEWECSNCKSQTALSDDTAGHPNFCPNCGADMRKEC